jgi:hypothetical protein
MENNANPPAGMGNAIRDLEPAVRIFTVPNGVGLIAAGLIAAGLIAGPAAPALAASGPGTTVSFAVYPAPVTIAGSPGVVVTRAWSHGVLTISAV